MNVDLRPYQERAVNKVAEAYENNKKSALIVLPTGLGKTCCMAAVAEKEVHEGGKVLFLAHRNTLLSQASEEIETMTGIDTGYIRGKKVPDTDILISSIQGMIRDARLTSFKKDTFSMVMIDEAHHMGAKTYDKIIEYFDGAKLLGVTATPKRSDDKDISEKFNEVCSEYTLCEAITEGWLSSIVLQNCPVNIDISHSHVMAGDYSSRDIGEALLPYMDAIADQIIEKAPERKTLIFVPLVATARGMAEILRRKGARADYVAGERHDSPEIMDRFKRGELNILVNSMLLTEGYNEPSVDCIVNLRATQSETLLRQIIGRGTRKMDGKNNLLILDFFWKNKKNRDTLSISDIIAMELGIDERDFEEVIKRCKRYKGDASDIMSLVRDTCGDVREEREQALLRAIKKAKEEEDRRKRILEDRQRYLKLHPDRIYMVREDPDHTLPKLIAGHEAKQISAKVYIVKDTNGRSFFYTNNPLFKALDIDIFRCNNITDLEDPTEKQSECLEGLGIESVDICCPGGGTKECCFVNKGYSGFIIGSLIERRKRGLCSYKQAKLLYKKGVREFNAITFSMASRAIEALSHNGWQVNSAFWDIIEGNREAIQMI